MADAHAPGELVLTEPQRAYLERWLWAAGDELGLRDWRIRATAHIAQDNSHASTFLLDRSDEVEIAVGRDFLDREPDAQRRTLVHELLHPHFHRVVQIATELIEHELGRRTEAVIEHAIRFHEEFAIERLANAIAHNFPPIEMPSGDPTVLPLDSAGGSQLQHA